MSAPVETTPDTGTTRLALAVFAAGGAAVAWVGAGYVLSSPLALAATALIAVVYLAGALELRRFHRATGALRQALAALQADTAPVTPEALTAWLAQLPAALRPAVRSRIDGARTPLPGPVLAPYLVGLLVLLGMLGTFVGMVATLKGAAAALQTSSDLATIRSALMAPVQGLGLAFGTSVAGVAASAALGLVTALCRRARLRAGGLLDALVSSRLQPLSAAGQRTEREAQQQRLAHEQAERLAQRQAEQHAQTLAALQALAAAQQQQAQALPALAGEWRTAVQALTAQQQALGTQLLDGQDRFHQGAQATHAELAASVGQSLRDGLAESARLAGATIAPAVDTAMAGITRETTALHGRVADLVQQQLDGLAARFGASVDGVAAHWQAALDQQRSDAQAFTAALEATQSGYSDTLAAQGRALQAALQAGQQQLLASVDATQQRLLSELATRDTQGQAALQAAQAGHAEALARQASTLLAAVESAQRQLLADLATRDAQRLDALTAPLQAMAQRLQQDWLQHGAQALAQQQALAATLQSAVQAMHADAGAQTRATVAEVGRLLQAAGEAPRAAAEAMAALRQQLSDSLARDQALQQERAQTAATLHRLLDEVARTTAGQRSAIDSLVAAAQQQLQDAAARFDSQAASSAAQATQAVDRVVDGVRGAAGQVAAASAQMVEASGRIAAASDQVAAASGRVAEASGQVVGASSQVAASAVELASLGEAFGAAVVQFGDSNQALVGQLAQIEAALARGQQRSDEQLAYTVAQAREIIELSLLSQKQIVDELQQAAQRVVGEAA